MKKLWISSGFLYSSRSRFYSSLGIGLALAGPSIALAGCFANALAINAARGFRGATQKFLTRDAVTGTFAISLEIRKKPIYHLSTKEKLICLRCHGCKPHHGNHQHDKFFCRLPSQCRIWRATTFWCDPIWCSFHCTSIRHHHRTFRRFDPKPRIR